MQQSLYVLRMPPGAINHLYSPHSEGGTAGTSHCSLREGDDVQNELLTWSLLSKCRWLPGGLQPRWLCAGEQQEAPSFLSGVSGWVWKKN